MIALILAAGSSTRLRPLTNSLPKCLLKINGEKTILDYQLEALISNGVKEVTIVVGFQKELIINHLTLKRYPLNVKYICNNEYASNGPILGGLLPAIELIKDELIFFHCDVLFEKKAIEKILEPNTNSVFLYRKRQWDEEAGKIVLGQNSKVIGLGKNIAKDRASGEYLQIARFKADFCYKLRKVIMDRAQKKQDGYTIDAFNDVIQDGTIPAVGVEFEGVGMEIDTIDDYENAKKDWK